MKRTMPKTPVIPLNGLPAFFSPEAKGKRSKDMAEFLRKVILERMSSRSNTVNLPSFNQFTAFFQCSHLELYDAFRVLRAQGFDFMLAGLDIPVQIQRCEQALQ